MYCFDLLKKLVKLCRLDLADCHKNTREQTGCKRACRPHVSGHPAKIGHFERDKEPIRSDASFAKTIGRIHIGTIGEEMATVAKHTEQLGFFLLQSNTNTAPRLLRYLVNINIQRYVVTGRHQKTVTYMTSRQLRKKSYSADPVAKLLLLAYKKFILTSMSTKRVELWKKLPSFLFGIQLILKAKCLRNFFKLTHWLRM